MLRRNSTDFRTSLSARSRNKLRCFGFIRWDEGDKTWMERYFGMIWDVVRVFLHWFFIDLVRCVIYYHPNVGPRAANDQEFSCWLMLPMKMTDFRSGCDEEKFPIFIHFLEGKNIGDIFYLGKLPRGNFISCCELWRLSVCENCNFKTSDSF